MWLCLSGHAIDIIMERTMRTGHWLNLTEQNEARLSVLFIILDYSKNPTGNRKYIIVVHRKAP